MNKSVFSHKLCNELLRRRPRDDGYVPSKYIEGAMMPGDDTRGFSEIFIAVDLHRPEADGALLLDAVKEAFRQGRGQLRDAKFTILAWDGQTLHGSPKCRFSGLEAAFNNTRKPVAAAGNWNAFCDELFNRGYHRAQQLILMCDKSMFANADVMPCRLLKNAVLTYIAVDEALETDILKTQMKSFALDRDACL